MGQTLQKWGDWGKCRMLNNSTTIKWGKGGKADLFNQKGKWGKRGKTLATWSLARLWITNLCHSPHFPCLPHLHRLMVPPAPLAPLVPCLCPVGHKRGTSAAMPIKLTKWDKRGKVDSWFLSALAMQDSHPETKL